MAETKEVTGLVTVERNAYGVVLRIAGEGGTQRTVYVGDRYAPEDVPENGAYGTFTFTEYPAKPGKKYGSKYLEGWDRKEAPLQVEVHSNGGARANYVDHHASIASEWAVGRAVELCCAEAKFAQARGYDIEVIARELLGMAQDLEPYVGVGKDGWAKTAEKSSDVEPA